MGRRRAVVSVACVPIPWLGLRKTSLIDYPGLVAAVAFLPGCNFRCPYCHNPDLVAGQADRNAVTVTEFFSFLEGAHRRIDGVVLSGGEPLLSDEALEIASRVRSLGFRLKIDTNGCFPDRLARAEADFVAMDLKTAPSRYPSFAWLGGGDSADRVRESVAFLKKSGIPHEFRTTAAPGIVGPDDMAEIASLLDRGDDFVINRFRPDVTLDPDWGSVAPYPEETLEKMLAIIRARGVPARIRPA
jgi:pyruvate formate lyase activating enzyme